MTDARPFVSVIMPVRNEAARIGRLDPVFKADLPIREAQIVQEALDRVCVRLVPAAGFGPSHVRDLRQRLQQRLGEYVGVTVEIVEKIPRGPGGKFRAVVSLLDRKGTAAASAERSSPAGRL